LKVKEHQSKLHVVSIFPSLEFLPFSATKRRILELSKRVEKLTSFYVDSEPKGIFPGNVEFIKIRVSGNIPRSFRYLLALFRSMFIVSKIKKQGIDGLYILSDFWAQNIGLVISKITRRPMIVRFRADDWTIRRLSPPKMAKQWKIVLRLIMLIYDLIEEFTLKRADYVISVSEFLEQEAVKHGVKKERVTTVYSGVTHDLFKPLNIGQEKGKFTLCFVGRLVRSKGLEYLIEAVKNLDVQVIVLGDGEKRYVENLKRKAPKNLRFLGRIEHKKVPKYINYSDILVSPSLSEGLPRTILEAMACGKPILATSVSGTPEIGFKGWLVEPRNVEELRKTIIEASKTPEKTLDKMGKINREIVLTKFNWTTAYDKINQIIETVIRSSS
jgi:glycosyltransferase involved in cell wall biosynthesis